MNKELKKIYNEGKEQGFIKNLSFKEWEKIFLKWDKEIKEMNKKEEENLKKWEEAIKEVQSIIYEKETKRGFTK